MRSRKRTARRAAPATPERSDLSKPGPAVVAALYLLAFLSGIAALMYEITWAKMLALALGSTTLAAAAVIAAFMGGMGLGARAYDLVLRRVSRPLLIYVLLEFGIALSTALLTRTFYTLPELFASASSHLATGAPLVLMRFVAVFVLLLLPSALMGATFPALCTILIRTARGVDRRLGLIYGINTVGAGAGALIAGLVLIERLGLVATVGVANVINVVVGLAALALLWTPLAQGDARSTRADQAVIETNLPRWLTGTVLFVSGLTTLSYEILWFRALRYTVGNSTYALSTVLAIFLVGLGLGSMLLARVLKRKAPERALAVCQLTIASLALVAIACQWLVLSVPGLREFASIFSTDVQTQAWWHRLAVDGGLAIVVMLPATLAMGLSFPLASRLFLGDVRKLGSRVGGAYLLANLGSICGAVLGATVLLPLLGTAGGTKAVAVTNLALGVLVMLWLRPWTVRRLFPALVAGGVVTALMVALPGQLTLHGETIDESAETRLFVEEGDLATVQVLAIAEDPTKKVMTVDGCKIGWSEGFRGSFFCRKQDLLAHLPMLLDTRIRHTLNVGLGSGSTLRALASYPNVETLDCVEISAAVVRGAAFFEASAVLRDPRVNLVVDDAVHFLLRSSKKYDLIVSDGKQHPFFSGNASLLCKEFYRYALNGLSDIGVFVQWLPLGTLASDFEINLRTLTDVFPHVEVFFFPRESVFVVGSRKPLRDRPTMTKEQFDTSSIRAGLAPYYLDNPDALRARWVAGKRQLQQIVKDAPVSTWDHLILDFSAFKASKTEWDRAEVANLRLLLLAEAVAVPAAERTFDPGHIAYVNSAGLLRRACAEMVAGRFDRALELAIEAVDANPDDRVARGVVRGLRAGPDHARTIE
ncbi:MAG: fused MFS/spermidine synthase [Planctomycetes bacterium]|nr:fused MFS/spermidine synthase [Planctomycetota bacterium]